jgi:hypothetical protein
MKKSILSALLFSMVLLLSGCGGDALTNPETEGTGAPSVIDPGTGAGTTNPTDPNSSAVVPTPTDPVVPVTDDGYTLTGATSPITITTPNQQANISVYVVDKNMVGVSGETVSIAVIQTGYGSVLESQVQTDSSGKATFKYQAPPSLTGLTSTIATIMYTRNGVMLAKKITIDVN